MELILEELQESSTDLLSYITKRPGFYSDSDMYPGRLERSIAFLRDVRGLREIRGIEIRRNWVAI